MSKKTPNISCYRINLFYTNFDTAINFYSLNYFYLASLKDTPFEDWVPVRVINRFREIRLINFRSVGAWSLIHLGQIFMGDISPW